MESVDVYGSEARSATGFQKFRATGDSKITAQTDFLLDLLRERIEEGGERGTWRGRTGR